MSRGVLGLMVSAVTLSTQLQWSVMCCGRHRSGNLTHGDVMLSAHLRPRSDTRGMSLAYWIPAEALSDLLCREWIYCYRQKINEDTFCSKPFPSVFSLVMDQYVGQAIMIYLAILRTLASADLTVHYASFKIHKPSFSHFYVAIIPLSSVLHFVLIMRVGLISAVFICCH